MGSIADELKKLQELLDSGALSAEEFARAKQALLDGDARRGPTAGNDRQIAELQLQNELLRIEQEWQNEREHHKVSYGKYSAPTQPNAFGTVMSLFGGVFAVGFGIFWMAQTSKMGAPDFFPLIGLVVIAIGIGLPIYHFIKYASYKSAYDEYQRRRYEVLAKMERNKRDKA